MTIYLATPVNGRSEKTLREKMKAAYERVKEMKEAARKEYPNAEFKSSFDILTLKFYMYDEDMPPIPEPTIMGLCVCMVMDSDIVIMDEKWEYSKGCKIEHFVAKESNKTIRYLMDIKV